MKLIVDQQFWDVFQNAQIAVLTVKGIDNHSKESEAAYFTDLLREACKEAEKHIKEEPFTQNPVIKEWREAFTQFKTKKGARSSIEALLKRVSQGREFYPINPLVDLYNSISLRYGLPCGGEDLAKIEGDLHLGKARGGESFFPLGAEEDAPALPEEIIYYDQAGAVCRNFNWREAQRTMLTEETKEAVLIIEAVNLEQAQVAAKAIHHLRDLLEAYFGVSGKIQYATADHPAVDLT